MDYISEFVSALKADNRSECTITNYAIDLRKMLEAIDKPVCEIRYSDLREWVNDLAQSSLAPATRARKVSAAKSFFRYLNEMEIVERNPAENLKLPKMEKKQPKVISEENASKIIREVKSEDKTYQSYMRDLAIVSTFLYAGIRREELTNIKLCDVSLENRIILIHGKGNKQRVVFMNDELTAIVSEYIMGHRQLYSTSADSDYLFVSKKSGKLCVESVNNIINKFMEKAGCKEKGLSCHQLRKRMATTAYKNTHDLLAVQRILGHSSPAVTQRYIADDMQAMKNAAMTISF